MSVTAVSWPVTSQTPSGPVRDRTRPEVTGSERQVHDGKPVSPIRDRDTRLLDAEDPDVASGEDDPAGESTDANPSGDGTVLGDSYSPVVHQVGEPESSIVGHDRGGDAVEAKASREVCAVAPQQHDPFQRHRDTHAAPADGEPGRGSR